MPLWIAASATPPRNDVLIIIAWLFLLCLIPLSVNATDWREQVRDLLEQDKQQAALHQLERAVMDARQMPPTIEKVNHLRFVAQFFCQAGRCDRGQEYFIQALDLSLALDSVWKKLSAVISVLELQQHTIEEQKQQEPLLQKTLDAGLLPEIAKNKYATEIGRYVLRFDGAERNTVRQLLEQIQHLENQQVRTKALFAFSEIAIAEDNGDFMNMQERPAPGADALERFLWHAAMARLFHSPATRSKSLQHVKDAKTRYQRLEGHHREKARIILKRIEAL
jgi:hypothetical protein